MIKKLNFKMKKGVPQGSVLGLLFFTIYINNLGQNFPNSTVNFYVDDTVIFCTAPTPAEAFLYFHVSCI